MRPDERAKEEEKNKMDGESGNARYNIRDDNIRRKLLYIRGCFVGMVRIKKRPLEATKRGPKHGYMFRKEHIPTQNYYITLPV